MFGFIKDKLAHLFGGQEINTQETVKQLEQILLSADVGVSTTQAIIKNIQAKLGNQTAHSSELLKQLLQNELLPLLNKPFDMQDCVYLLVGINGSGKTTLAGKLAWSFTQRNKTVLLAAADTFRAAAPEQLALWAQRSGAHYVRGRLDQDPASVVFQACTEFAQNKNDILIIDTAGRLQTKINLMHELQKIKKVIAQRLPDKKICTLLTIDAMLGQNSLDQARLFHACTPLDGIVLTKIDGTAKGGIVFAISQELSIPIAFLSYGEKIEDLKPFVAQEFVRQMLFDT